MPKKVKELVETQSCEKCKNFDLAEDHQRCTQCVKQAVYSRFRPNEEQALLDSLDANPILKAKIKQRWETEDASNKV